MSTSENYASWVESSDKLIKRENDWYDKLREKLSEKEKPGVTLRERAIDLFGEENVSQTDGDPLLSIRVNIPNHRSRLLNIVPGERLHQATIFEKRNDEWELIDRLSGAHFEEAVIMAARIIGF